MLLTPHEQERLVLSYAAELARRRRARGTRLKVPEVTALITDHLLDGARDGVPELLGEVHAVVAALAALTGPCIERASA